MVLHNHYYRFLRWTRAGGRPSVEPGTRDRSTADPSPRPFPGPSGVPPRLGAKSFDERSPWNCRVTRRSMSRRVRPLLGLSPAWALVLIGAVVLLVSSSLGWAGPSTEPGFAGATYGPSLPGTTSSVVLNGGPCAPGPTVHVVCPATTGEAAPGAPTPVLGFQPSVAGPSSPPPEAYSSFSWDPASQSAVLFGGLNGTTPSSGT